MVEVVGRKCDEYEMGMEQHQHISHQSFRIQRLSNFYL